MTNLKNATKKQSGNEATIKLLKEAEFKLKISDKERQDHNKIKSREIDTIQPIHYDDFSKNHDIIKKIRKFKFNR